MKKKLYAELSVPAAKGTHIVHDSRYGAVTVQVVSGPRTLDKALLLSALVKTFSMSPEDAERFMDACRKEGGTQNRLAIVLKQ